MAIIDLGKIKPINRGTWSNATTYMIDDFVLFGKHTFISKTDSNLNNTPYVQDTGTLDSTNWEFMAKGSEIDHKGEWDSTTSYTLNDVVRQKESSFICINAPALNQDPYNDSTGTLNGTYWAFFANGNRLVHQGEWASGTAYILNDLVTHGKHTFRCTTSNSGQDPYDESTSTLNNTYWAWFAQGTAQSDWNAESGDNVILNKPKLDSKFGGALRFPRRTTTQMTYRQSMVIMNDGTHRSWGASSNYAHGRGDNNPDMDFPSGNGCGGYIVQGWIARDSMTVLDDRGRIWGWGYNSYYGHPCSTSSSWPMPREIRFPHSANTSYFHQYPLNGARYRVYEMSMSDDYSSYYNYFAIYCCYDQNEKSGEFPLGTPVLCVSGTQNYGQLGVGNTTTYSTGYSPLSYMKGKKIKQICIGDAYYGFVYALTDKSANHRGGELWTWGYNSYGQLGQGNTSHRYYPTMRNGTASLPNAPVKYIWCTGQGSYGNGWAIMEDNGTDYGTNVVGTPRAGWSQAGDGGLYGCGHNNYGTIGHGGSSQQTYWVRSGSGHRMGTKAKWDMIQATPGNYVCAIAIDAWGDPWTVGYNGYGELGRGNTTSQNSWGRPANVSGRYSNYGSVWDFMDKLKLSSTDNGGYFNGDEEIVGQTSGARAWICYSNSPLHYGIQRMCYQSTNKVVGGRDDLVEPIYTDEICTARNNEIPFVEGETIVGQHSGRTGVVATGNTFQSSTSKTAIVTANSSQYIIDGVTQPTITMMEEIAYTFDVSDSSNTGHEFSFSVRSNGTHSYSGQNDEVPGVVRSGTPGQAGATVTYTLPRHSRQIAMYYWCRNHSGMGSSISIQDNFEFRGIARHHRVRHVMSSGTYGSQNVQSFITDRPVDDEGKNMIPGVNLSGYTEPKSAWDEGHGGQIWIMGQQAQGATGGGSTSNGSAYHSTAYGYWGHSYYPQPNGPENIIDMRHFGYDGETTTAMMTAKGQVLTMGYSGSYADGHGSWNQHYYRPGLLAF